MSGVNEVTIAEGRRCKQRLQDHAPTHHQITIFLGDFGATAFVILTGGLKALRGDPADVQWALGIAVGSSGIAAMLLFVAALIMHCSLTIASNAASSLESAGNCSDLQEVSAAVCDTYKTYHATHHHTTIGVVPVLRSLPAAGLDIIAPVTDILALHSGVLSLVGPGKLLGSRAEDTQ